MSQQPVQPLDLDAIEDRAAALYEFATVADPEGQAALDQLAGKDVPALIDELRQARAEIHRLRTELTAAQPDVTRALTLLAAADWYEREHHTTRMFGHQVAAELRRHADTADPMVGSLARDGFGPDEITDMLRRPPGTEAAGHYQPDRDPHAGPLILDGRHCGGCAWDEPAPPEPTKETSHA